MKMLHRLRTLFRRRSAEAEMQEEMRYHLEQRVAEFESEGMSPEEARFAAQRKFGNLGRIEEQARDAWGWGWLERLAKDLSFAFRQLVRSPGFSLLAIVTLGLGIGANTSMFSALNGVVLKKLPYANLDQLDRIYRVTPQSAEGNMAPADSSICKNRGRATGNSQLTFTTRSAFPIRGNPLNRHSAHARAQTSFPFSAWSRNSAGPSSPVRTRRARSASSF